MQKNATKILVAEDNSESMYLVTYLLEKAGYAVVSATNGLSAVQLCLKTLPNLVLMDIRLPDIDGYEAVRRIKQISAVSQTPIVAFTAFSMGAVIEKSLKTGCVGHLEKPINTQTFVQQIETYLLQHANIKTHE